MDIIEGTRRLMLTIGIFGLLYGADLIYSKSVDADISFLATPTGRKTINLDDCDPMSYDRVTDYKIMRSGREVRVVICFSSIKGNRKEAMIQVPSEKNDYIDYPFGSEAAKTAMRAYVRNNPALTREEEAYADAVFNQERTAQIKRDIKDLLIMLLMYVILAGVVEWILRGFLRSPSKK